MKRSFEDLKTDVVEKGLCTGCGTCVGVCPHNCLSMGRERMELEPVLIGICPGCNICYKACPGKDVPLRDLEGFVFGTRRTESHQDLGVYRILGEGHAANEAVRRAGASGGLVSALLQYCLDSGLVDCALVAGFDDQKPYHTKPYLITSDSKAMEFAQSKYAMVSLNMLLGEVVQSGFKKLAVVGCPCHIHGIRKLQMLRLRPDIGKAITLVIGLLCGTQFYFEGTRHVLVEGCGLNDLNEVRRIQYRGGEWPGHFVAENSDGDRSEVERHHYVYHMLMPGFQRDRCIMCLDWSSELSDISVGDNWAASREEGKLFLGESCFIVRSEIAEKLIKEAENHGYVNTHPLEIEDILGSPGFELKKHGAGHRWVQRRFYGWPTPDYQYEPNYQPFRKKASFAPEKNTLGSGRK